MPPVGQTLHGTGEGQAWPGCRHAGDRFVETRPPSCSHGVEGQAFEPCSMSRGQGMPDTCERCVNHVRESTAILASRRSRQRTLPRTQAAQQHPGRVPRLQSNAMTARLALMTESWCPYIAKVGRASHSNASQATAGTDSMDARVHRHAQSIRCPGVVRKRTLMLGSRGSFLNVTSESWPASGTAGVLL